MPDLPPTASAANRPLGVILMGGESRRMGAPKAAIQLAGQTLFERTVAALEPQCREIAVVVREKGQAPAGVEEIIDAEVPGAGGPLLGVLAALRWAAGQGSLLTTPVDTPFLPADLAVRLEGAVAQNNAHSAVAMSKDRMHGLTALFAPAALPPAEQIIVERGERMLQAFHLQMASSPVRFSTDDGDPFANLNDPSDLAAAENRLSSQI